jgi:hypothetical protein
MRLGLFSARLQRPISARGQQTQAQTGLAAQRHPVHCLRCPPEEQGQGGAGRQHLQAQLEPAWLRHIGASP